MSDFHAEQVSQARCKRSKISDPLNSILPAPLQTDLYAESKIIEPSDLIDIHSTTAPVNTWFVDLAKIMQGGTVGETLEMLQNKHGFTVNERDLHVTPTKEDYQVHYMHFPEYDDVETIHGKVK